MQFGTPITIISGGINEVNMLIPCPHIAMIPSEKVTPRRTTKKEIAVALTLLRNKKKITIVTNKVRLIVL